MKLSAGLLALLFCTVATAGTRIPGDILNPDDFRTVVDGRQISLETISNGKITAQITNFYGYIVGLFVPDRDGNYTNVVGYNKTIQEYIQGTRNPVGTTVGRFAGRLGNGIAPIEGKIYNITKNSGKHTLHGGAMGLAKTIWDFEKVTRKSVTLSTVMADGLDGWPGNLKIYVKFYVKGRSLYIKYTATTDKTTHCSLSHHAYFNLNGMESGDILGHYLQVDADNITECDSDLIPTGRLSPVEGTAYDFRKETRIGDRQFSMQAVRQVPGAPAAVPEGMVRNFNDAFCLNHSDSRKLQHVATLYAPESGRVMEMFNNHPVVHIYTGSSKGVAMESQMHPDAPNHPEFPSTLLHPGETYRHTIEFRFSTR